MTIGQDIYTELTGDAGLTALVSTRIYPNWMPQEASLPAVSYNLVSESVQNAVSGELGLRNYQFQFDCWGSSYGSAQSVAGALISAVQGASLFKPYRLSQQDLYEPQTDTHRVSVDFSIWQ